MAPACPDWVPQKGRAFWHEIADMLADLGVMGKPHTAGLAMLVDALADWLLWTGICAESDKPGDWIRKDAAWKRSMQALREFGATPSSMTAVRQIVLKQPAQGLPSIKLA